MIPKEVEEKAKSVLAKNSFSAENGDEIIVNQKDEDIYHAYVKTKNPGAFGHMVINGKDLSFLWANSSVSPDVLIDKMKCGTKQQNNGSVCSCGGNCACGNSCNCANKKAKKCKCLPFIIILSITTLGSLALAGYEMWLNNQKPNTTTNVEEKEETEVGTKCDVLEENDDEDELPTKDEVLDLLTETIVFHADISPFGGFNEHYKYYLTLIHLNAWSVTTPVNQDNPVAVYTDIYEDLTYDKINKKYHFLFGKDEDAPLWQSYQEADCNIPFYDADTNKYVSFGRCGGRWPSTIYQYEKHYFDGDKMIVEVSSTTYETGYVDGNEYYYNITLAEGGEMKVSDADLANFVYSDLLPKYNVIYEKQDNHYVMKDVVRTN